MVPAPQIVLSSEPKNRANKAVLKFVGIIGIAVLAA